MLFVLKHSLIKCSSAYNLHIFLFYFSFFTSSGLESWTNKKGRATKRHTRHTLQDEEVINEENTDTQNRLLNFTMLPSSSYRRDHLWNWISASLRWYGRSRYKVLMIFLPILCLRICMKEHCYIFYTAKITESLNTIIN